MIKVSDIFEYLNKIAPCYLAASYDNVGLLVGDPDREASKILVALDITESVIAEAVMCGAQLIVSHHPVIFEPMRSIVKGEPAANRIIALLENKIAVICMHTNLDAAHDGVNTYLAKAIGINEECAIEPAEDIGIGRIGMLKEPMDFDAFLLHVAQSLNCEGLRYKKISDSVSRVAVGGGSCGSLLVRAKELCADTFVTADIKYNQWLDAQEMGINLIDAGHFSTENVAIPPLADKIGKHFTDINVIIAKRISEPMSFFINEEEHHGA